MRMKVIKVLAQWRKKVLDKGSKGAKKRQQGDNNKRNGNENEKVWFECGRSWSKVKEYRSFNVGKSRGTFDS